MEALLAGFGLTQYESRVLACLLSRGEGTGPQLSRDAAVPFGRVYDTLHGLEERGLVVAHEGRPRRYVPVPVSAVPSRLLAAQRRRLQEEEQRLAERTAELAEALRHVAPGRPGPASAGVRVGEGTARQHLVEATHAAKGDIVVFLALAQVHEEDLDLFDAFRQAMNRNVNTRILLRHRDVDTLVASPFASDVMDAILPHLGRNLQVRLSDSEAPPFSVLDRQRAVVGVRDPIDPSRFFAVVHMDDPAFAGDLVAAFDGMWQKAEGERGLMQTVLKRLGDSEGNKWVRRRLEQALKRKVGKAGPTPSS